MKASHSAYNTRVLAPVVTAIRALAATVAAMLPRRYWRTLDSHVPVSQAALAASIMTWLAGAALGFFGFLAHLDEVVSANSAAYLEAAVRTDAASVPLPSALSGLAFFTFILLTPQGWISSYLALSGFIRMLGTHFDDPHGDFILTLADAGLRTVSGAARRRGEIDNRHLLEGPRVRDRVVRGAQLELPDVDVVIVSSRLKDGWEPGTVILSNCGEFRIVDTEDRMIDGRLRRLYYLAVHRDLEVFRRTVPYDFPAGFVAPVSERAEPV